jgi:DsrC like protein
MAPQIAREAGIETLTPQHWQVVEFMRHEYAARSSSPNSRPVRDFLSDWPPRTWCTGPPGSSLAGEEAHDDNST